MSFVGARRNEETLKSEMSYVALPACRDRTVIVSDTMLATGGSIEDVARLLDTQRPRNIIVASVLGSRKGVARVQAYGTQSTRYAAHAKIDVCCAAIDVRLNEKGFILPGLGDAGDRMYGNVATRRAQ